MITLRRPALILASTSRHRRAQLERLGLQFTCEAPGVDERALDASDLTPAELAARLARAKATAVAARHPEALVIGGDQVAALGSEILHQPGTRERAVEQLSRMAGRTHQLHTALCVAQGERLLEHLEPAHLTMRPLDAEALERYVDRDSPLDCAGSYMLEAGGIALFERIECADASSIQGVPLLFLVRALAEAGVPLP